MHVKECYSPFKKEKTLPPSIKMNHEDIILCGKGLFQQWPYYYEGNQPLHD